MHLLLKVAALGALLGQDVREWPSSGGFDVVQLERGCAISASYSFDGRSDVELRLFDSSDGPLLLLTSLDWSARQDETYQVSYQLDDVAYAGEVRGYVGDYVRKGFSARFRPDFLDAFAGARSLLVTRDDVIVTHLSLQGSAGAVSAFRECERHVERVTAARERREARWDYIERDPFAPSPADAPRAPAESPAPITSPSWSRAVSADFPERAQERGISAGRVILDCEAAANGSLSSCVVIEETPAGAGFGQAALAGARRARLSPRSVDGAAAGARVRFTVPFAAGGVAP